MVYLYVTAVGITLFTRAHEIQGRARSVPQLRQSRRRLRDGSVFTVWCGFFVFSFPPPPPRRRKVTAAAQTLCPPRRRMEHAAVPTTSRRAEKDPATRLTLENKKKKKKSVEKKRASARDIIVFAEKTPRSRTALEKREKS